MKKLLTIITISSLAAGCSMAQLLTLPTKPWNATIKVVGEDGQPVNAAEVLIFFTLPPYSFSSNSKYSGKIFGVTDTNGLFSATHVDRSGELRFQIQKAGYYSSGRTTRLSDPEDNGGDRNISMTIPLKKIGDPIAMYAKSVNLGLPVFDKSAGFDLMMGDWVAPYGTGINADIIFFGHLDKRAKNDSDYTLTVSFPKQGDGIQEFIEPDSEKSSELRSPHEAPVDGYKPEWVQFNNRKPKTPTKTNRDMNRNYFFRVRTVVDDRGNVVSAHYGKIYGDFMRFDYYLNPTASSRNIEFDPKQDLIHDLKSDEGVNAP